MIYGILVWIVTLLGLGIVVGAAGWIGPGELAVMAIVASLVTMVAVRRRRATT